MQEDTSSSSESEESEESSSDSSDESEEEDSDSDEEESLDEWGELTSTEIEEYESLYNFYMKPAVRVNEEIAASGMILRKKVATAFLLRSKNSIFRQKLHKKIVALEKIRRKGEIYKLLKKMKQFDSSSTSLGDGPSDLMDEILGERNVSGVEILSASPVLSSSSNLKSEQSPTDTKTAPKNDQDTSTKLTESDDDKRQGKIGKYSQANVNARFMSDGSVLPVHKTKVLSDGRYQRPVGRGRNGYSWDDVRGVWKPSEDQPPASMLSSPSTANELNEIRSPQPIDGNINLEKNSQTLTSNGTLDDTSTSDKTDITDDLRPPSNHSSVVSPTDSKMAATTEDSQQQKKVIDLLDDDGDGHASNEKPSGNEGNKETEKADFIDLSGLVESNSGAQPECIDLSRIDEPVVNSNEVIVID